MPAAFAYIDHPLFFAHEMGLGHPESPARLRAIVDQLNKDGVMAQFDHILAEPATREQVLRVHSEEYLKSLEAASPKGGYIRLDADTIMNSSSLNAAFCSAGAVVQAVDAVCSGLYQRVFCAVRPPGHHAVRNRAMGFCFFNNIAIGAAHALSRYGLSRVVIVDFDVHHGNGTEEIFCKDTRVHMISIFERGNYPGSGLHPLGPNMHNVPLIQGDGGVALRRAVESVWEPAMKDCAPELILVSAGFDGHREDPLGGLNFSEEDYRWITDWLVRQSIRFCQGRMVSSLEGGYNTTALARSVSQHIQALIADLPRGD